MQNKEWDRTQQQQNENSERIKARGRKNGGWVGGWMDSCDYSLLNF